jgi:xanthosine utilization system XapX-like protein
MSKKTKRFCLLITTCGVLGVVLGATTSQAAMNRCLNAEVVTNECLTQNPTNHIVGSMSMGLFAGVGAAVGATWQVDQKDK